MKKAITILFVLICATILGVTSVQAVTATANLNASKSIVKPGENFTVALSVTCANEINGIITSYSYDTDRLELISASAGTNFASLGENNNIELIAGKTGITDANVFILEFKAKESITEETTATVSVSKITVSPMTGEDTILNEISIPITIKPETNQNGGNTTPSGGTTDVENTTPSEGTKNGENTTASSNASDDETINTVRNTNSETNNNTSGKKTSVLPYTGIQPIIIGIILVISIIAVIMYLSFRKYKNI